MTNNHARYRRALLLPLALVLVAPFAGAGVLLPTDIGVSLPDGTQDPDKTSPFSDDVLLDSLTFNGVVYDGDGANDSFRAASRFEVLTGRDWVNAEWGDDDDGSDGDTDPFTKAGFDPADQETTDPTIQDAALLNAFNSLSLSEISDGENDTGSSFSFKVLFDGSLAFNDVGGDDLPDLVFFERGLNDEFVVDLIIGGSFANPIYSAALTIDSSDFWDTGFEIDTMEISNAQKMGVGGFDLSDWQLSADTDVFGFRLSALDRSGPDLGGFFLAAEDPDDFGPSLVPLPATVWMLLPGIGFLGFSAARRRGARG
ncbi:MAG: VPLPA-CTERM sorting domain-containing protein [Chromatiaceae bacterium]|nr:VPLPA-CTERM sorting domain-containing protein [Chromatiaceae bacterium]